MTVICEVLVQVTSNNSGGRARIWNTTNTVANDPKLYSKPDFLTNRVFVEKPVNSWHVVKVRCHGSHRKVMAVLKSYDQGIGRYEVFKNFRDIWLENVTVKWGESVGEALKTDAELKPEPEPELKPDFSIEAYIDPKDMVLFNAVRAISFRKHTSVLMIGPSGYGKTTIPQQLSKNWDLQFLRWDCSQIRDPEEFFGFRAAIDGSTADKDGQQIFIKSEFTKMVEEGNCVIVLDELNRTDPYISNALFPMLDHAGETTVLGHKIKVGPNVIFFATINVGHQFTGTFTLDAALNNRFPAKVLVGPLPEEIEIDIIQNRCGVTKAISSRIVRIVNKLRELNKKGELDVDVSTRVSLQLGDFAAAGMDIKDALVYTVINGVSEDETKIIADAVGIL